MVRQEDRRARPEDLRLRGLTGGAALALACLLAIGCGQRDPSDDPADWDVESGVVYTVQVSAPRFIVPSDGLPAEIAPQTSNNNVDIEFFDGRLFVAWRSAPTHFASEDSQMWIASSTDGGASWAFESLVELGTDVREPRFLAMDGELQLLFFEAGTTPTAFEPIAIRRTWRLREGEWTVPEVAIEGGVVPWDVKVRDGIAWMTSYRGEHYGGEDAVLEVGFSRSEDGVAFEPVDGVASVYTGGVSEVAFEFDESGGLWAVTRNEDGDETGWGSHVCTAEAGALGEWDCPDVSDPERYDSPELFRHGDDLYLAARRDIGGPFGGEGGGDLLAYSTRPKTTALYAIDRSGRSVEHLLDLPGAGDTAFPSVRRTGAHTFLLANYTSPLDDPEISWIEGQTSERGTQIYLLDLAFVPE